MKRFMLAVCAGIMVMCSTVYAGDSMQEPLDFTDDLLADGSSVYYFEEVAVTLPAAWRGKYSIEVEGNSAAFYHKASREKWMENYGSIGGKLFTLSYSVNHDFQNLPDFYYIGFSEESVFNYYLTFPTDAQAYMEDSAIAEEFQQMNSEIGFIKEHAYMLGTQEVAAADEDIQDSVTEEINDIENLILGKVGDSANTEITEIPETTDTAELLEYHFDETQAGYEGTWVDMKGGYQVYLPSDWNVLNVTEQDVADYEYMYMAASEDESTSFVAMGISLEEFLKELDAEELEELRTSGYTMLELIREGLGEDGCEMITVNNIPCAVMDMQDSGTLVMFLSEDETVYHAVIVVADDLSNHVYTESILHSVRWVD